MLTAAEKIRRYCEYQDRSEWEVRRKIAQLLVPQEERNNLIHQLIEEKFVDDERFAESFIRGKMNQKRWGRIKIRAELMQHGIPSSLFEKKMAEVDDSQYMENLRYLADKWQRENPSGERAKMIRHLLSKGYTMDEINNIN
ncbi:MAG: regulatory protein RecX [Bacteroidales bacterium]|nr:regulatory protein RecX [Bacteroidales bacterium]